MMKKRDFLTGGRLYMYTCIIFQLSLINYKINYTAGLIKKNIYKIMWVKIHENTLAHIRPNF